MDMRLHKIINVAMTLDGELDTFLRKEAVISSASERQRMDELRDVVRSLQGQGIHTVMDEGGGTLIAS
jgi:riboflavin biosynthesis pyrimidine reductase